MLFRSILSQCSPLVEVRELLERINIVNPPFSEQFPLAQLHWIVSDENESITVESMSGGLHIYDNPVGVLTNNPPFPQHDLTSSPPSSRLSLAVSLECPPYMLATKDRGCARCGT